MKKILILIIFLTYLIGNAQCPAPSNVTIITYQLPEVTLGWTENGTATEWDVLVISNFDVGTPLPTVGWISATTNPFTLVGVPPSACNGFFVRSVCSATDISPWAAVGSIACSPNILNYLATLSNDIFVADDNIIKIFPNPSSTIFKIVSDIKIDKITIFDTLGKEILIQTQNNNEINVENLQKGVYLIEISTENGKTYQKFIKE